MKVFSNCFLLLTSILELIKANDYKIASATCDVNNKAVLIFDVCEIKENKISVTFNFIQPLNKIEVMITSHAEG